jgi:hypothetical protein
MNPFQVSRRAGRIETTTFVPYIKTDVESNLSTSPGDLSSSSHDDNDREELISVLLSKQSYVLSELKHMKEQLSKQTPQCIENDLKERVDKSRDDLVTKIRAEIDTRIRDEIDARFRAEIDTRIRDEIDARIRDETDAKTQDEIGAKIRDEISERIRDDLDAKIQHLELQLRDQIFENKESLNNCLGAIRDIENAIDTIRTQHSSQIKDMASSCILPDEGQNVLYGKLEDLETRVFAECKGIFRTLTNEINSLKHKKNSCDQSYRDTISFVNHLEDRVKLVERNQNQRIENFWNKGATTNRFDFFDDEEIPKWPYNSLEEQKRSEDQTRVDASSTCADLKSRFFSGSEHSHINSYNRDNVSFVVVMLACVPSLISVLALWSKFVS